MSNESQLIYSKLTSQPFDVFDERGHVVVAGPRPLRATAPALVEVDQPERALEVRARQGGEVVAALAGPAVQEDDRRDTCRRCSRNPGVRLLDAGVGFAAVVGCAADWTAGWHASARA